MDDFECSLLCQENVSFLEEDEELQHLFIPSEQNYGDAEDEYVGVLIQKEISQSVKCFKKDETLVIADEWLKRARMDAIDWILNTRATFGFRFQTAYLSVAYFDRVLLWRSSDLMLISDNKCSAIRLLSIACLSVAAKMEGCSVPGMSQLIHREDSLGRTTLHSSSHKEAQGEAIRKMELLVLTTLEWNMDIVTPFSFLSYFITKLCRESPPPNLIFSKTEQLILATMKEINLMNHKPSVIAAAASLVTLYQDLTLETMKLKMSSIPQHHLLEPNDIYRCYIVIQRLYEEEEEEKTRLHAPSSSYFGSKQIDMKGTSQVTSSKRRLTFNAEESHGKGKSKILKILT